MSNYSLGSVFQIRLSLSNPFRAKHTAVIRRSTLKIKKSKEKLRTKDLKLGENLSG